MIPTEDLNNMGSYPVIPPVTTCERLQVAYIRDALDWLQFQHPALIDGALADAVVALRCQLSACCADART